jgi:hypothetical protein
LLYVQHHPEKVSAFIGVAQLVSLLKAQQAQYDFVSTEAARRKDEATLARLSGFDVRVHDVCSGDRPVADREIGAESVFFARPGRSRRGAGVCARLCA